MPRVQFRVARRKVLVVLEQDVRVGAPDGDFVTGEVVPTDLLPRLIDLHECDQE